MNKTTRVLVGALTSVALVTPAVGLAAPAQAQRESSQSLQLAPKAKKKKKLTLSAKKAFVHANLTTDTVTATANGFKKGKVAFAIDGVVAGTVKLKKGKAKKLSISSYNTTMTLATTAVTVNRATYDAPQITGQLVYKGSVASQGWVDTDNDDGALTIGADSPDLLSVAMVNADGTFKISTYDYLEYAPGTYTKKTFFEYDAGFDEYLFGTPVTITVI